MGETCSMARPLRIECPGALSHDTSRGDRQEALYADDDDREVCLSILGEVVKGWHGGCSPSCLMRNHYPLLIETPDGHLAQGMRQLNGVDTPRAHWRHGRVGPLFQGRDQAILVDGEVYGFALSRSVVLHPVRAGIVATPEAWHWSSCTARMGHTTSPAWLGADSLVARFGPRRPEARRRSGHVVMEGLGQQRMWQE